MKTNFGTIQKLARLATHPSTNPNEAIVAGWKACFQILGDNPDKNITWLNAYNMKASPQDALLEEEIKRLKEMVQDLNQSVEQSMRSQKILLENHEQDKAIYLERISRLTRDCDDWQQESERLQAINEFLMDRNDLLESSSLSDTEKLYVNYELLVTKAEQISGHNCSKSSIAFALDVPLNMLSAWQKVGIVPVDFMNKIKEFSEDQFEPASRAPWSADEVNNLKELLSGGLSDLDAARTLSERFSRRWFEPNVARKRRQLADHGWKPSPKDRSTAVRPKEDAVTSHIPETGIDQSSVRHNRVRTQTSASYNSNLSNQ